MAKISITAAAKMAGVSRSTLYRSYIDKGVLSLCKDRQDKPRIDTSELLRVFGALQLDATGSDSVGLSDATPSDSVGQPETPPQTETTALEIELKLIKEQLAESREREGWYKQQIDHLTQTMKRLEAPKQAHPIYPRLWWQFWK